ncbi:hypothetical protein J2P12_02450 [Candidatus Bathyarchaeota archaeon]|nr:hypothetical protein [Candidatus Bathyarchaeota archaeon]
MTVNPEEKPVLLSLDGRGFYVIHYSAIPENELTRIRFDLADPNTGEGGSAEAVVDPRLVEALNAHNHGKDEGRALLIWIDTQHNEVRWQLRKIDRTRLTDLK